jgi:prevent-host-death family protein
VTTIGVRELSHHTSRYLAQVRAGKTLTITDHGRPIAVLSPAGIADQPRRPRPKIGGYRSAKPWTAEELDAELASGFGAHDRP